MSPSNPWIPSPPPTSGTSWTGTWPRGGTVIVSSHVMDLVQRMCDHVAVVAGGRLLAAGTVDQVRAGVSLEERFVQLVGGRARRRGSSGCAPSEAEAHAAAQRPAAESAGSWWGWHSADCMRWGSWACACGAAPPPPAGSGPCPDRGGARRLGRPAGLGDCARHCLGRGHDAGPCPVHNVGRAHAAAAGRPRTGRPHRDPGAGHSARGSGNGGHLVARCPACRGRAGRRRPGRADLRGALPVVTTATASLAASRRFKDVSGIGLHGSPGPPRPHHRRHLPGHGGFRSLPVRAGRQDLPGRRWAPPGHWAATSKRGRRARQDSSCSSPWPRSPGFPGAGSCCSSARWSRPPYAGSSRRKGGRMGLFALLPATPTGAITARSLTYWFRDPRYSGSLVVIPLLPVVLAFQGSQTNDYRRPDDHRAAHRVPAGLVHLGGCVLRQHGICPAPRRRSAGCP